MSKQQERKRYKYLLIFGSGLLLWLAETWFFGWNDKAESAPERFLDGLSVILIVWGIVGDILTNVEISKKTIYQVEDRGGHHE